MDKENTCCFAWIVSLKRSCNERWARFRNRLRRRFYARRGQIIDPSTIVNETGTKDMVISRTSYKSNKVLPEKFAAPSTNKEEARVDVGSAPTRCVNEDVEILVGEYVSGVIIKAANTLKLERQESLGKQNIIEESFADDNVSLSPSIISQIANIAVTESLSNILLDSNVNQSAIHKDIKDFMVQLSLELLAEKLIIVNLLPDYNC